MQTQTLPKTPPYPHDQARSKQEIEEIVVWERLGRYNRGLPCGPKALHTSLAAVLSPDELPSERTIARILARNGLTHCHTGWYEGEIR